MATKGSRNFSLPLAHDDHERILRREIELSLDDPRPSIPAEKVFAKLRSSAARMQRERRGARN
jgi:hypothetical protein